MTGHPLATHGIVRGGTVRRIRSGTQRCVALLFLALVPTALHATTYLFSFTVGDILNGLKNNSDYNDELNVTSSAYFSIFLQPAASFTQFLSESSPNASAPNDPWTATTIQDYADLGSGTWAQFSKGQSQSQVAVISNANGTGTNIFLNTTWSDNYAWPIGWGNTTGSIKDILPLTDTLQFTINTTAVLSGVQTVYGVASAIVSKSPVSDSQPKTATEIPFELTTTPTVVPEPDTLVLFAAGAICLLIGRKSLRRRV